MKNYRKFVPFVMIFLMVISIYYFFNNIRVQNNEYNSYVEAGDKYYEEKLYVRALNEYAKAQNMRASVEVDKKEADCYETQKLYWETTHLYEKMLDNYPKNIKAYEYALEYFQRIEDYESVYDVNAVMIKRKLYSKTTSKIMAEVKFKYSLVEVNYTNIKQYFNGYCVAENEDGKKGLISQAGRTVLAFKYAQLGDYYSDCIPVVTEEGECYFIDGDGNRTLNFNGEGKAEKLGIISEEKYWVKTGDTYAYYDTEGKKLSNDYMNATNFNGGVAAAQRKNKWIIINSDFNQVGDEEYTDIIIDENGFSTRKGFMFVDKDGKGYQLADSEGNIISDTYYEEAKLMIDGTYAAVKKNGKWGFIDTKGKEYIEPQYEDAKSFANEVAAVQKNGKWGFINIDNKMVIDNQYDDVQSFNENGACFVKQEERWRFLQLYSKN